MISVFLWPAVFERAANGADAAVHHVRGRDDVAAGLDLDQRLAHQDLDALVIGDIAVDDHAVMAVIRVGIEGDVAHHADPRARPALIARTARHTRLSGLSAFAAVRGLQGRIGLREQGHRPGCPAPAASWRGFDDQIDRQPLDAGHGGDRFARAGLAVDDEQRPDQIGRRKCAFPPPAGGSSHAASGGASAKRGRIENGDIRPVLESAGRSTQLLRRNARRQSLRGLPQVGPAHVSCGPH